MAAAPPCLEDDDREALEVALFDVERARLDCFFIDADDFVELSASGLGRETPLGLRDEACDAECLPAVFWLFTERRDDAARLFEAELLEERLVFSEFLPAMR